jgi:hypothetical protein
MLTSQEVLYGILVPLVVAAALAAIAAWRRWPFAMPLAVGVGFLVAYACLKVPSLPPRDGTDWLFWLAIPATLLGALDARWGRYTWGVPAVFAGLLSAIILSPLVPASVSRGTMGGVTVAMAVAGLALAGVAHFSERRLGAPFVIAALCVVAGGAGVTVFSCNLRSVGIYGIALAAALGPVAVLSLRTLTAAARGVAVTAAPLLAGLLVAGHFYADPGITPTAFATLIAAPLLLLVGAVLPLKRPWLRGVIALLAVTIAVAAITAPAALAAKRAAEADPYEVYK